MRDTFEDVVSVASLNEDAQTKVFPSKGVRQSVDEVGVRVADIGTVGSGNLAVFVKVAIDQVTGFRVYAVADVTVETTQRTSGLIAYDILFHHLGTACCGIDFLQ